MTLKDRIRHAWNMFSDSNTFQPPLDYGYSTSSPGHKLHTTRINESEFSAKVFNRIAMDVSMTDILHVKMDANNGNSTPIKSGLFNCLSVEANIDQSNREFLHDLVYSLFDEGVVAVVPVVTDTSPSKGAFDILEMRVAKVREWHTSHVKLNIYNDKTGRFEDLTLPKSMVALIENPLYVITNAPNSTLKRIINKIQMLDAIDSQASSSRLNLILQLPYAVKGEVRKNQASERINALEAQLNSNKYGVAYVDGAEKITQLNRPLTNNILDEIKYLTEEFYNQIGLTNNIFNGTASEAEMRSYYSRTIDPIVDRIISEFYRKFLTKTARTQGHKLIAYRDPFKLVPVEQVAEIADKMARNQILTSNEIRRIIGFQPNPDPKADELRNPNIAPSEEVVGSRTSPEEIKMGAEQK